MEDHVPKHPSAEEFSADEWIAVPLPDRAQVSAVHEHQTALPNRTTGLDKGPEVTLGVRVERLSILRRESAKFLDPRLPRCPVRTIQTFGAQILTHAAIPVVDYRTRRLRTRRSPPAVRLRDSGHSSTTDSRSRLRTRRMTPSKSSRPPSGHPRSASDPRGKRTYCTTPSPRNCSPTLAPASPSQTARRLPQFVSTRPPRRTSGVASTNAQKSRSDSERNGSPSSAAYERSSRIRSSHAARSAGAIQAAMRDREETKRSTIDSHRNRRTHTRSVHQQPANSATV